MPIRKNTRRFDPRYFMDERTDVIEKNTVTEDSAEQVPPNTITPRAQDGIPTQEPTGQVATETVE